MTVNLKTNLPIKLALLEAEGLRITSERSAFQCLQNLAHHYREKYAGIEISKVPGVQIARRLFRELNIEPTKHRPASEALLRRALKGLPLYPVNNLVDVCNWCALDFLLPNGVYDRQWIEGTIVLRKGLPGEQYIGHTGLPVHLENRYTLADNKGSFGSPITDSQRAGISAKTTAAVIVIYAPTDYEVKLFRNQSKVLAERIKKFCGGEINQIKIIIKD